MDVLMVSKGKSLNIIGIAIKKEKTKQIIKKLLKRERLHQNQKLLMRSIVPLITRLVIGKVVAAGI